MIKKIFKIIQTKKIFTKPQKKKFLILDSTNYFIFNNYLNLNEVEVLNVRYESLNFFILLKNILKLKFSMKEYIIEYIRAVSCKYIITFIDNNIICYELKDLFPNIKIIVIQNGMRTQFFFDDLAKKKNLKTDYLLTFSEFYSSKFSKIVKGKFIPIGSFKNNLIEKKNNLSKKKSVSFISSGPLNFDKVSIYQKIKMPMNDYYSPEKYILPILKKYCYQKNFDLNILCRSKSEKNLSFEKSFYDKILGKNNFQIIETFNYKDIYNLSDISTVNISIYSAFGLECLARGNRTVILNVRDLITKIDSLKVFWSTRKIKDKGFFWTNEISEKEIFRVLDNSINCSDEKWRENLSDIMPTLTNFDKNNTVFKNLLI